MDKNWVICDSEQATIEWGKKFGDYIKGKGGVVALLGDLGSGKTTFMKGVAQAFGIKSVIKSPTFVLLKEYPTKYGRLVHVDAYRLEKNFEDIGLDEYMSQDAVFIEWADRLPDLLPISVKIISFEFINEQKRKICFRSWDEKEISQW